MPSIHHIEDGGFAIASKHARLFFLDPGEGKVLSIKPDGTDLRVLVSARKATPDGIAVDPSQGHVYWTNMGADPDANNGSIERCDLDGGNLMVIVPLGGTFTPKQLKIDNEAAKLYWCDREGMRIMRANLDGSAIETLVVSGQGEVDRVDACHWCVGIAIDPDRHEFYWTQKGPSNAGKGRMFRAGLSIPPGETAENRTDIELLFEGLPEPIDIDLDLANRTIYWTDRGDPPSGNTVNRSPMDVGLGQKRVHEVLLGGFDEAIGLALDLNGGRMFITDLGGSLYVASLNGTNKTELLSKRGRFTGIAYVEP